MPVTHVTRLHLIARSPLLILVFSIELALSSVMGAQSDASHPTRDPSPLWTVRPKQAGYDSIPSNPFSLSRPGNIRVGRDIIKVQFLNSELLALAWGTSDEVLKKQKSPGRDRPSHLHLSILSVTTGAQVFKHEWPCGSSNINVAYTANSQWLVRCGESVQLYSSSFDKLTELRVRKEVPRTFDSASGRSFLVYISDTKGSLVAQLRDSATFEVIDSWNDPLLVDARFIYSDRFVLAETQYPHQLFIREIGKTWNSFPSHIEDPRRSLIQDYEFINDETLARSAGHNVVVETIDGTELFRQPVPEPDLFIFQWLPTSAISSRGERFGVILGRMRGLRSEPLDIYPYLADDRVMVYGLREQAAVFSVRVKGTSPWYPNFSWNRIALSPDGRLLGIVSSEGVRMFSLPAN